MGFVKLLLAGVLCSTIVTAAPSLKSSGKVVYDNVISEHEAQFTQHVEIDLDKQTEVFRIPAHRHLDAAETMHDFRKGYSVTCFREKTPQVCFLSDLSHTPNFPPDTLNLGMTMLKSQSGGVFNSGNSTVLLKRWVVVNGPLGYTAFLSAEMGDFVGDLPLFRVEPLPEDAEMLEDKVELSSSSRHRRDILKAGSAPQMPKKCTGGILPSIKVGVVREDCAYIFACKTPTNCRADFHVTSGTFVRCQCCPGETTHNQCLCWDMGWSL